MCYKKKKQKQLKHKLTNNNSDDEEDQNGRFEIIESSKLRKHVEVVYEHVVNKVRKLANLCRKLSTKQSVLNVM